MVLRHSYGKVTWVDLEAPSQDEVRAIMREFDIDGRIEDEIITPTPYPLFIGFSDYVYTILHFPTALAQGGAKDQEIDFIIGKDFLITCRYEVIDSIYNLHKVFEAETLLGVGLERVKGPVLLERLLRRLYAVLSHETEDAARRLERIERDIFEGRERAMVRAISEVGRTLLRFETAVEHHTEVLAKLVDALATPHFFGKGFIEHGAHIKAERDHAAHLIQSYRAVARELRDTNDSLLSTSQNEVMKELTIMAFVTFPLSLVATIFGMNTLHTPIIGASYDFWIVLGAMFFLAFSFFCYFKFKRWL